MADEKIITKSGSISPEKFGVTVHKTTEFYQNDPCTTYYAPDITGSSSEQGRLDYIFDFSKASFDYITDNTAGFEQQDTRELVYKIPFRKADDSLDASRAACTHQVIDDNESNCPCTNESQQWLAQQTNNFTSNCLLSAYVDDGNNNFDTKIYYHHVENISKQEDYYDYIVVDEVHHGCADSYQKQIFSIHRQIKSIITAVMSFQK